MTLCCDREDIDPQCRPNHWTEVIQEHCKGTASRIPQSGGSPLCATYRCSGEIHPYSLGQCSPTSEREVSIEFIVDPSFKIFSNWKERILEAVENSNRLFQPTGIRFTPTAIREMVVLGKGFESEDYLTEVERLANPTVDIHVGVIGTEIETGEFGHYRAGTGVFFENRLVLTSKDFLKLKYVLPHELGHIFGAVHTDDYSSLMYPTVEGMPNLRKIDRLSREIILLSKCMDFRTGVASLDPVQAGLIADIYATLLQKADINPLALAYEELADRFSNHKDYASQLRWSQRAHEIQPTHPFWCLKLGVAYTNTHEYGKAETQFNAAMAAARTVPFEIYVDDFGKRYPFQLELRTQFLIAMNQRKMGHPAKAKVLLLQLTRQIPEFPRLYLELAWAAADEAHHKEAVSYLETFLQLVPGQKDAKAFLEKEKVLARKPASVP